MKTAVLTICMVLFAASALATDISQIVFDGFSTTTSDNIRITPMDETMLKDTSKTPMQSFVWRSGKTENFTVTKSKTYALAASVIGAWIQVDQATHLRVNSESAYMLLPSGFNDVILFGKE